MLDRLAKARSRFIKSARSLEGNRRLCTSSSSKRLELIWQMDSYRFISSSRSADLRFPQREMYSHQDQAERGLSGFDFHVYRIAESPDWRVSRRSRYLASEVNVNPLLMI